MKGAWPLRIGLAYLAVLTLASLLAPVVTRFSPTVQALELRFAPPGTAGHLLGTDELGRDVLARVIHGGRSALSVGAAAVLVAGGVGVSLGLAAALGPRWLDQLLMLGVDSLLSFPAILLAIAVVSFLGYGWLQVTLAIGLIFSPLFGRLIRAEALAIRSEGYYQAAYGLGMAPLAIIRTHVLPNLAGKIAVQGSILFALSVVVEASLSYLGLGTQPPTPSWGLMLKDARHYLVTAPWLAVYPGVAIATTVLSLNMVGDALSDRLNPRL